MCLPLPCGTCGEEITVICLNDEDGVDIDAPGTAPDVALAETVTGRVLAVHGAKSLVEIEGRLCRCALSGRLKRVRRDAALQQRSPGSWQRDTREVRGRWERSRDAAPVSSPIAVGDTVIVSVGSDDQGLILERLERTTWLGRVRPTKGPQVIAANTEIVLIVMAVASPDPDFFLLDQFLVQAAAGKLEPWIIFNKMDLLPTTGTASSPLNEVGDYRNLGYPVYCTSTLTGAGISDLETALRGRTAVLAGPSGVGKSHLLNCLIPNAEARIGEISEWSGRGQHTTTHVAMYPLPSGGYLVDAPGIRRLSLWQVVPEDLPAHFPEFEAIAVNCGYHSCAHLNEKDCAVRLAAEADPVLWRRHKHYRQMRETAAGITR